jgi:multiple sugar transport system permease protein
MAIIGEVGRRSPSVRMLNLGIHAVLILGALTMVYPFLIMLSGSVKSSFDTKSFSIVPPYLVDELTFFQKHLTTKYNDRTVLAVGNLKEPVVGLDKITPPAANAEAVAADFTEFLAQGPGAQLDQRFYGVGMMVESGVYPMMLRAFRSWLQEKYGKGDEGIQALNLDCATEYLTWDEIRGPFEDFRPRRSDPNYQGFLTTFQEFKETCTDPLTRYYFDVDGYFVEILLRDHGKSLEVVNEKLGTGYVNWTQVVVPDRVPTDNPAFAQAWEAFVRQELSIEFIAVDPAALGVYREFLKERYSGDLNPLNTAYGTTFAGFADIDLPVGSPRGARRVDWLDFISDKVPVGNLSVCGIGQLYRTYLRTKYADIDELNRQQQRGYASFAQVDLPETMPEQNLRLRADWNEFVDGLDAKHVGLKRSSVFVYRKFLSDIYADKPKAAVDYGTMSQDYELRIAAEKDVPAFNAYPEDRTAKARTDYVSALQAQEFKEMRSLRDPASLAQDWAAFLAQRHGDVATLNRAYGLVPASIDAVAVPAKEWEWVQFRRNKGLLRGEFLWRNYAMVIDTLVLNGSAAMNTVIYCLLAILAALIVNPLAAYALSRYRPPSAYKILLLLMLTMAFPPMVLGIPNFLMIKNMGLLNTFWALVLPGMASGYSIFLLKGFFDSLPKELFECATIDGASEWTMFWQIAMTLSKPILAVIALQSFTMAYGNFMMAFLVCQNPKMWTIMVYLYDLQQRSSPAVGFAALVIAAIPTLLVFVFCQNIIIRGIVVPTEK